MSRIIDLYQQIDKELSSDHALSNKIHLELTKMYSNATSQAMQSDEGYCFKFTLPMTAVSNLYSILKLNQTDVSQAFQTDWKYPKNAMMYNDPYYHILILLIYYGIRKNDKQLVEKSLLVLLFKLWNGRKYAYFKYCDKRIMNYVVTHMVNNKHNVAKYDNPLSLLKDYFVPTLLTKYQDDIKQNDAKLKQLFMQSWCRLDQMFKFNAKIDIETGQKKATGGLLPLYMKAKEQGLYMSTPTIMKSDDDDSDAEFTQYSTIHNRDEIITSTVDSMTMGTKPSYPMNFVNEINKSTKVSTKVIGQILNSLHTHTYYDHLHDLITLILSRTNISEKTDICRPEFMDRVKKNIISSKNNDDVRNIQKILCELSDKIFKDSIKIDFNKYSNAQKMQICNVVLYGVIFNLRKHNSQ